MIERAIILVKLLNYCKEKAKVANPTLSFSVSTLLQWVHAYGYPCLVVLVLLASAGAPLPTEALLIGLGVLSAQTHGPNFLILAVLSTGASVSGDLLDYWMGRLGGPVVRKWLVRALHRLRMKGSDKLLADTHGWRGSWAAIFVTRFLITWLGTPISILAGTTHVAFATFLIWDFIGEAIYATGNLAIGRWAGAHLTSEGWTATLFWGAVALVTLIPALLAGWRWLRQWRSSLPPPAHPHSAPATTGALSGPAKSSTDEAAQ